jgi:hypothetical protein
LNCFDETGPVALRQTTGFVESLLRQVGLDWSVPDFSTLSFRQQTVTLSAVSVPMRRLVFALASPATAMLLLRLAPFEWARSCSTGDPLRGESFCTVAGNWHIGWEMPAIRCLFSIGILLISLSPTIRVRILGASRYGTA